MDFKNGIFFLHALKLCLGYNESLKGQVSLLQGVLSITALPLGASLSSSVIFNVKPALLCAPHIVAIYM